MQLIYYKTKNNSIGISINNIEYIGQESFEILKQKVEIQKNVCC